MIGFFLKREIDSNYKHEVFDTVDEIHDGIKILFTDLETLNGINIFKHTEALIVVLTKKYLHEDAKYCYQCLYHYYLQVNNKSDIDDFLTMILSKEQKDASVVLMDDVSKIVVVKGNEIKLTNKEFLIFKHLNDNRGELCERQDMLINLLGYHNYAESRIIDVYIRYLRTKLGSEGKKIETIRGQGYIYHL